MTFLDGYRVLDLTDARGLLAGRILADLGADVVQVEPANGSSARSRAPRSGETSYLWEAFAANKRGIAVDFDSPDGVRAVRDLAAVADVVLESAGVGVMANRSLDYDDLRCLNERLVYVSITAFGRNGPKAAYAESDLVVWAAAGLVAVHRDGDRPPLRMSLPQSYLHAAADAASGALLALLARERTGRGQLVEIAAQTSVSCATLGSVLADAVGDVPRDLETGAPTRVDQSGSGSGTASALKKWQCADGVVEFHLGIGPAAGRFTGPFFAWMVDEGIGVQRFAALDWRAVPTMMQAGEFTDDDMAAARAAVADFLATKTKSEVLHAARDRKLLCVPVYDTTDVRTSEQLSARDYFVPVGDGDRRQLIPGRFATVDIGPVTPSLPAPTLGEHSDIVGREWLGKSLRVGAGRD